MNARFLSNERLCIFARCNGGVVLIRNVTDSYAYSLTEGVQHSHLLHPKPADPSTLRIQISRPKIGTL